MSRAVFFSVLSILGALLPFALRSQVGSAYQAEDDLLPSVTIDLPEGELDLLLSRWLRASFFEGQIRYNFVKGDITAFLRYRYYGYRQTYQLGVFDEIGFEQVQKLDNEFQRIRGISLLVERPYDYHRRLFVLGELDQISSNKPEQEFSDNRTNAFVRVGYQLGTPEDERSNEIVGIRRVGLERLFTAHRKVGPHGIGLTTALTWGFDWTGADFDYVKLELEGLKRFNLGTESFLIGRFHGGTFLQKKEIRDDPDLYPGDRYAIPRDELFSLSGRDSLKGIQGQRLGTEEIHLTAEYFVPWFVNETRNALKVSWETWYWIVYGGYGTAGFESSVLSDLSQYISDVGFGFEAAFRLKTYPFFVGAVFAKSLDGEGDVKARFSLKTAF